MPAKKVKSPTGRPSKVNPDLAAAMRGKGGKRESTYTGNGDEENGDDSDRRARKMDKGLPLKKQAQKKSPRRMSQKPPKGYDY